MATTSQWISSITVFMSVIFYFCANTAIKQNAFLYIFSIGLTVLIVDMLFMNESTFQYEPHYENWTRKENKKDEC